MAARLFSDMVNRLASSTPGCPNLVLINYIRDASIEVCERTLAWRYVQADITLVAGTYFYSYVPPSGAEVHAILTATVNNVPIPAMTLEDVGKHWPGYPSSATADRAAPRALVHIDADTFYVAPVPDGEETYTMKMIVALKPLRTATGMEQAVLDDLETVIMHGALQHLLVLPDKPWSDRELAAYHAKQYIFKVAERRARTNVGSGRATLSVAHRPWA